MTKEEDESNPKRPPESAESSSGRSNQQEDATELSEGLSQERKDEVVAMRKQALARRRQMEAVEATSRSNSDGTHVEPGAVAVEGSSSDNNSSLSSLTLSSALRHRRDRKETSSEAHPGPLVVPEEGLGNLDEEGLGNLDEEDSEEDEPPPAVDVEAPNPAYDVMQPFEAQLVEGDSEQVQQMIEQQVREQVRQRMQEEHERMEREAVVATTVEEPTQRERRPVDPVVEGFTGLRPSWWLRPLPAESAAP